MTKQELRGYIRQCKKNYSREQLQLLSLEVCRRIQSDGLWRAAGTVLMYHALPDEVNLQTLMDQALAMGKRVLLPVVVGDEMILREYHGLSSMSEGAFGILEPEGERFVDEASVDLVLVPGMAFDNAGHRLGRGKGYYDKTLPRLTKAYRMGVCFPFQVVENVPVDEHDMAVNEVIQ